jgi:hypothetical protein
MSTKSNDNAATGGAGIAAPEHFQQNAPDQQVARI